MDHVPSHVSKPEYQAKRVGYLQSLVVTFSWLDFAGDVSWTHQRYYAWNRGDEPYGRDFAITAMIVIITTIALTGFTLFRNVLGKHNDKLVKTKAVGSTFTTPKEKLP